MARANGGSANLSTPGSILVSVEAWLNLVEGFFSKLTRSVLRHIRVSSKQELRDRIMAAMDFFNRDPVVHTWTYKLDKAA